MPGRGRAARRAEGGMDPLTGGVARFDPTRARPPGLAAPGPPRDPA